jgi:CspA family cold shock protein
MGTRMVALQSILSSSVFVCLVTPPGNQASFLQYPITLLDPVSCTDSSPAFFYFFVKEIFMNQGTVKWFNDAKGFGFITPDQGGEDLFAHYSEIGGNGFKTLKENQRVEFDVKMGPKGKQACAIKPL